MHIFGVLADDARRQIVETLAVEELSVNDLTHRFAVSQPAMSRHLRVLREHRLVRAQVEGQRRLYQLDPYGLAEVDRWLAPYRRFWADRLEAFNRFLDANAAPPKEETK